MLENVERLKALLGEDYLNPEFAVDGTRFKISKLLPMEGFAVLEILRPAVVAMVARLPRTATEEAMILTALAGLSASTVQAVMDRLFAEVRYTSSKTQTPQPVAGQEAEAFDGLDPIHVYGVLARALLVNFRGSFTVIRSLAGRLEAATDPSEPAT